jgi:hypothetical protein
MLKLKIIIKMKMKKKELVKLMNKILMKEIKSFYKWFGKKRKKNIQNEQEEEEEDEFDKAEKDFF